MSMISFSVCLLVVRKAVDFCMSYPATRLKLLIISRGFLMEVWRSIKYNILSANRDSLTLVFSNVCILHFLNLFFFFLHLLSWSCGLFSFVFKSICVDYNTYMLSHFFISRIKLSWAWWMIFLIMCLYSIY